MIARLAFAILAGVAAALLLIRVGALSADALDLPTVAIADHRSK